MGNVLNTAYKVVADVIESEENINIEQGTLHVIDDKLKVHLEGEIKEVSTKSYKVYTALLTQSGTDAPVATVLENTIGNIWFGYIDVGVYSIHSNGLFTEQKTVNTLHQTVNISYANDGIYYCYYTQQNNELLNISVYNESITLANDFLYEKLIEIRVYN